MNSRVLYMLDAFVHSRPLLRRLIVLHCNDNFIKFLTECVYNIQKGHLVLLGEDERKLRKFVDVFKVLLDRKTSMKKRRHLLSTNRGQVFLKVIAQSIQDHFASEHGHIQ